MILSRESNYLQGDCWAFAWEIHKRTGWPAVRAGIDPGDFGYDSNILLPCGNHRHILVDHPSGMLIDATGWVDRWSYEKVNGLHPFDQAYYDSIMESYGYSFPDTEEFLADDVSELLETLGYIKAAGRMKGRIMPDVLEKLDLDLKIAEHEEIPCETRIKDCSKIALYRCFLWCHTCGQYIIHLCLEHTDRLTEIAASEYTQLCCPSDHLCFFRYCEKI
jgi:hypothetical protein